MGLSHIFKTDKHIPCTLIRTYHLFACRCACACVRESERERDWVHAVLAIGVLCVCVFVWERKCVCVCARMCLEGGGWDFTFLRSVVYWTNPPRAWAGYCKVYCICFHAYFLQAMQSFLFPFVVVVPCRLFVCCCMEACGPLLSSSMLKVLFLFPLSPGLSCSWP